MMTPIVAVSLLVGVAACAAKPAPPVVATANSPKPPSRVVVTERAVKVKVPAGFEVQNIEFGDATHGYALMHKCSNTSCEGRFFATEDAGVTWTERPYPAKATTNIQFYVGDSKTVWIWQEKQPSLISTDGGRNWKSTKSESPAEYEVARDGRFGNKADVAYDHKTGRKIVLPRAGGYLQSVWDGEAVDSAALWVTYVDKGLPVTYVSKDAGKTWKPQVVLPQQGRKVFASHVLRTGIHKYEDLWLVADQEPISNGGGSSLLRSSVLKASGLPLIWKYDLNRGWVPFPINGIKEDPAKSYSVAPAGAGALFVGGDVFGWLDKDGFVPLAGVSAGYVSQLRDGTVVAQNPPNLYVAPGPQNTLERSWVRISLSPQ